MYVAGGRGGKGREVGELNRLIGAERLSQSQAKTKKPKSKCPKNKEKKTSAKPKKQPNGKQTEKSNNKQQSNNNNTRRSLKLKKKGSEGRVEKGARERAKGRCDFCLFLFNFLTIFSS